VAQKKIPIEARREIYALLSDQLQVKASDVTAVLKKYGVTGDAERLQERYRRRLAQSLMSALRDEQGRREVFAVVNASGDVLYVPIEYCNSRAELKQIRQRMRRQMIGLDLSSGKVDDRLHDLDQFANRLKGGR
jgi:hypothetical protein